MIELYEYIIHSYYTCKATFKSKVMKGLYKTHYCCPDPLTKSVQLFPKGREEEEEEEDVAVGNGCVTYWCGFLLGKTSREN